MSNRAISPTLDLDANTELQISALTREKAQIAKQYIERKYSFLKRDEKERKKN